MAFGQSIPVASPIQLVAGFAAGEAARYVAREAGCGATGQKLAAGLGHGAGSAATGYAINAALGADATGAVVTTGQSTLTATLHALGS